jgi:hypothetical protein
MGYCSIDLPHNVPLQGLDGLDSEGSDVHMYLRRCMANFNSAVSESWRVVFILLLVGAVPVQAAPESDRQRAPGIDLVINNAQVVVRSLTLRAGKIGPIFQHTNDFVVLFLTDGRIRTSYDDGHFEISSHVAGDVAFGRRGTIEVMTALSAPPIRIAIVELKSRSNPLQQNPSDLPNAFPRPGAKKVLGNDRVVAWNYTWKLNVPTNERFHAHDAVIAFLGDGPIKSTTPDGESVLGHQQLGQIVFSKKGLIDYETLVAGRQSAIILELK